MSLNPKNVIILKRPKSADTSKKAPGLQKVYTTKGLPRKVLQQWNLQDSVQKDRVA